MRSIVIRRAVVVCALLGAACSRELALPEALPTTGYLSGTAVTEIPGTDQAQAVAGAQVSVPGTNVHGLSDQAGAFVLGPLPAGTYRVLLVLQGQGGGESHQRLIDGVTVVRGATKSLGAVSLHRNAQVAGRVLLDGKASGNVGVVVFIPGTELVTSTGDNGQYNLRGVSEGVVRISAYRAGFTPASTADMTVQGGVLTTAVDLVLPSTPVVPQPGAVSGHVSAVGADGNAAALDLSTVVIALYEPGNSTPRLSAHAKADGTFEVDQIPQGIYWLRASVAGYPPVDVPNLLVTGGTSIHLPDALVLTPLGSGNVAVDGGPPGGSVLPGGDAGTPDAGPGDAGTSDAGSAQCTSDAQCSAGNLCVDGFCVPCRNDSDCQSGFVCRKNACTRQCQGNLDCPGGQVCSAGTCGSCVTSSDCRDASKVCLPGGACGHCRDGNDCPSGKACLATGCGACSADGDCGAGRICDGSGACIPGACHDNGGCPATQICGADHACGACSTDSQCSAGRLCLGAAGSTQCVVANCRSKQECTTAQACLSNLCGSCAQSTDCGPKGGGLLCDPSTHACVPGDCNADSDCPTGKACSAHSCIACGVAGAPACPAGVCNRASDCTGAFTGFVCKSNACVPCGAASDCDASQTCALSQAQPRCVTGDCDPKTGCQGGLLCVANHCSACASKADCEALLGAGHACTAQGKCIAGQCASGADCSGSQACVGNACQACTADTQCDVGKLCLSGQCLPANCHTRAECSGGQACVGNQCGKCSANADCGAPGSGLVCDPSTRLCTPGTCNADADCGAGSLCVSHVCAACGTPGGPVCPAAVCNKSADCTGVFAGFVCKNNACVTCSAATDCDASQTCALSQAQPKCVAGNCDPLTGCANGQICVSNTCRACSSTADCTLVLGANHACTAQGKCIAGACASGADCSSRQACVGNACVACTSDGQCDAGNLCLSGQCLPGNCHTRAECTGGQACIGNQCGSCGTNADCGFPSSGFVCDPTAHLCTAGNCNADADCGAGKYCSGHTCNACGGTSGHACPAGTCNATSDCTGAQAGLVCKSNACVTCSAASDCGSGQTCALSTAQPKCVAGDCDPSVGCANGQICVANKCSACGTKADCEAVLGANHACTAQGKCITGQCASMADCSAGHLACIGAACQTCTLDTQCEAGSLCLSGQCLPGNCKARVDCTAGQACVGNVCGSCAVNADCGYPSSGYVCDPGTRLCAAGTCNVDADCTNAGQYCSGHTCAPCGGASGHACTAGHCNSNPDCTGAYAGMACISNNCLACGSAAECGSGQVCTLSQASHLCVAGDCDKDADCGAPGKVCVANRCTSCGGSVTCPAGQCNSLADCVGAQKGYACINHGCAQCTSTAQCGAGKVCTLSTTVHQCVAGTCDTAADCTTSPGMICVGHGCTTCATNTDCTSALGASHVCIFPTQGQPGQCIAGTCAQNSDCTGGQACIGNVCQACGADANCTAGSICLTGVCTPGNCHDIKDCTSKGQVCVSNTCTSCTVEAVVTASGGGCNVSGKTSGFVCDSGACVLGACVQNTDCLTTGVWNGQLCTNHACQACSAGTSSQCGAGYACISGKCTSGGCNSNADCLSAAAMVCNTTAGTLNGAPSHTCYGNCRTGADCVSTNYCNAAFSCAACSTSADCGTGGGLFSGLVCVTGKCVTGACNADVTPNSGCPSGQVCNGAHACVQVAPTIVGTGPSLPSAGSVYIASPTLVEGRNGYYFWAATLAGGTEVGLIDPLNLTAKWMVADGSAPATAAPALVLPAPGLPGGEVFFAQTGGSDWAAHNALDGSRLWLMSAAVSGTTGGNDLAAGVINPGTASATAVVYSSTSNVLNQLRPDGTGLRKVSSGGGSWISLASGTSLLYGLTGTAGLVGVNPNTMTVAFTLPYSAWNAAYTTVSNLSSVAVTRLPSGNGDRIWFSGFVTGTGTVMFAADMLDADVAAAKPATITFPAVVLSTSAANAVSNPKGNVLIDGQQSAYLLGNGTTFATLYKVTPPPGAGSATLNVVTTPFLNNTGNVGNSWYALLGDPSPFGVSVVSYDSSGQMVDIIITGSNQYTTQWTLAHPGGGSWSAMWPGITSSGLLDWWGSTGGPASVKLLQALGGATFKPPANSWAVRAGDSGGHSALSLQAGCTSDANCASTQTCALGQCVGQCRSATDCPAGLGCSAGLCGACIADSSCGGTTNTCYANACVTCTAGATCCHTTADCSAKGLTNNTCVGGMCEPNPAYYADLQNVLATPATDYPALMAEGTDGVVYVLKAQNAANPVFIAYDPATATELWRTAAVPQAVGTTFLPPMVVRLPGAPRDTIFWADSGGASLYSFSGGAGLTTPVAVTTTTLPTKVYGAMALGSVKSAAGKIDAANGAATPALFGYGLDSGSGTYKIWAIDAAQAAAGTLKTWWLAPTQCSTGEPTVAGTGLFVLGDGAVLHACNPNSSTFTSGVLQLWEPNGDGSNAATVNAKLRWSLTGQSWILINMPRAAVGQVGNTDVVYLPATTNQGSTGYSGLVVIPIVRGATGAPTLTYFFSGISTAGMTVLADAKGNGVFVTDGNPGQVFTITPAGAIGTTLAIANQHAMGASLGADGLLYTEGNALTGVIFDPALKPTVDWTATTPNNVNLGNDQMMLLHNGRLVMSPLVSGPGRDLVFYNVGTKNPAPAPAWSAWGGDNQHRQSVEAMNAGPTGF
jgi:hypothetical protein